MHPRTTSALVALALTGSLVGLAPTATASEVDCDDPAHPITVGSELEVVVGTRKSQTGELAVYTNPGCVVDGAVAVVTSPRTTYRVTLEEEASDDDTLDTAWRGSVRIKPSELRNSDAGVWTVRYEVDGGAPATSESTTVDGHVLRATRASFDAGPEPVRDNKITFTGTLERADWNTRHYKPVSKPVVVRTLDRDDDSVTVDVVALTTKENGKFRKTVAFPGAGPYWVSFEGGKVSGPTESPADRVSAP